MRGAGFGVGFGFGFGLLLNASTPPTATAAGPTKAMMLSNWQWCCCSWLVHGCHI